MTAIPAGLPPASWYGYFDGLPSRVVLTHLPLHNGRAPQLEQSAIAHLGHGIEPLIRPLGFNWKIGVGLLTSVIAREVIVGTLGTIYGVDPATQSLTLQNALQQDLTPAGAMALLVFFAFAMQCTSTLAVVRRETNSWKWPVVQFVYMTGIAYSSALWSTKSCQGFSDDRHTPPKGSRTRTNNLVGATALNLYHLVL